MQRTKVLFVINNFFVGGVERFIYSIISRFDFTKVDVTVVTIWGTGKLEKAYRDLGIQIIFAGSHLAYTNKNPLLKLYFAIISPITLVRLVNIIRKIRPNIVFTCLTQADILGILAATLTGVKHRIIHHTDVHPLSWIRRQLKRWAVSYATNIVTVSSATKAFMQEYFGAKEKKIIIIPNGIDFHKFSQPHLDKEVSHISPVVGFIGRLESIKGPQYLLTALESVKHRLGDLPKVVIWGDGSLRLSLEQQAKISHLDNVEFKGETSVPDVAIRDIDILVVPSQSEGFGLVALEGLAAGKVVVAANLPALAEFIEHNRTGMLFESENPLSLAATLMNLIDHPDKINQIKHNVVIWREQQGQKFTIENVAKEYQKLLLGLK